MEWFQAVTIIFSVIISVAGICWAMFSRLDAKIESTNNRLDAKISSLIEEIHPWVTDFHGRLCSLEKEKK